MIVDSLNDKFAVSREEVSFDMCVLSMPNSKFKKRKPKIRLELTHKPTGIKIHAEYYGHSVEIEERLLGRLDVLIAIDKKAKGNQNENVDSDS